MELVDLKAKTIAELLNGKQFYMCKDCNRKFVDNINFENMKYHPKIIALTLDLYFQGMSLRKIAHHLKQFYELDISYKSVHNWIKKYIGIRPTAGLLCGYIPSKI